MDRSYGVSNLFASWKWGWVDVIGANLFQLTSPRVLRSFGENIWVKRVNRSVILKLVLIIQKL